MPAAAIEELWICVVVAATAPAAHLKSGTAGSWTMAVEMPCTCCAASGISIGAMFTRRDMLAPLSCSRAATSTILLPLVGGPAACTAWSKPAPLLTPRIRVKQGFGTAFEVRGALACGLKVEEHQLWRAVMQPLQDLFR